MGRVRPVPNCSLTTHKKSRLIIHIGLPILWRFRIITVSGDYPHGVARVSHGGIFELANPVVCPHASQPSKLASRGSYGKASPGFCPSYLPHQIPVKFRLPSCCEVRQTSRPPGCTPGVSNYLGSIPSPPPLKGDRKVCGRARSLKDELHIHGELRPGAQQPDESGTRQLHRW